MKIHTNKMLLGRLFLLLHIIAPRTELRSDSVGHHGLLALRNCVIVPEAQQVRT